MKKTIIVVALAAALVFALGAAPAFAKYAGYQASMQYVPWSGSPFSATSMASLNPDAALMASGPHKGYATTTIKCAVCHSVHRGGGKLLNDGTVCAFCHTNAAWGGGAVSTALISWYGGGTSVGWSGPTAPTTSGGPHSSCAASFCHGGPHGVGASTYAGAASKLLVAAADANIATVISANEAQATANGGSLTVDTTTWNANMRALATGALCARSGCHVDSALGVVAAGTMLSVDAAVLDPGGAAASPVTGHRVIATDTTTWNANGTDFPTTKTNLTIAWEPVAYCDSCHDLADDNNSGLSAFPHAITGVVDSAAGADGSWRPAVWLTAGAFAGDTSRAAVGTYNQYAITARGTSADPVQAAISASAGSSVLDGTCNKCHRADTTTNGVGLSY